MTREAKSALLTPLPAETLSQELRVRYLAALFLFARVGGIETTEETTLLSIARGLGLSKGEVELAGHTNLDARELQKVLEAVHPRHLLRDVLRVAVADGQIQSEETETISKLAEATKLTINDVAEVFRWVVAERKLLRKWQRLTS